MPIHSRIGEQLKLGGKRNYIEKIKENLRGKREITLKKNSGNVLQA
jgi:hypothetical protein